MDVLCTYRKYIHTGILTENTALCTITKIIVSDEDVPYTTAFNIMVSLYGMKKQINNYMISNNGYVSRKIAVFRDLEDNGENWLMLRVESCDDFVKDLYTFDKSFENLKKIFILTTMILPELDPRIEKGMVKQIVHACNFDAIPVGSWTNDLTDGFEFYVDHDKTHIMEHSQSDPELFICDIINNLFKDSADKSESWLAGLCYAMIVRLKYTYVTRMKSMSMQLDDIAYLDFNKTRIERMFPEDVLAVDFVDVAQQCVRPWIEKMNDFFNTAYDYKDFINIKKNSLGSVFSYIQTYFSDTYKKESEEFKRQVQKNFIILLIEALTEFTDTLMTKIINESDEIDSRVYLITSCLHMVRENLLTEMIYN
ncbi:hypothetical protein AL387_gp026 [Salmon gill poxvirus]|uniref:Uncharacterized protein n=1 Tax=Salmon gill poxvirus TaxID=1680908 RepID=A0A0H4Y0X5_9POXV|nr:hypothetical protein AL387_gp026 [Salmon gill poxvirus]AKR04150.1 hypothetical protein SGPV026 [Salmon gill poxvirus]